MTHLTKDLVTKQDLARLEAKLDWLHAFLDRKFLATDEGIEPEPLPEWPS